MKRIVTAVLAAALLMGSVPAYANDINITIDNEAFVPKNALGEVVHPFIENGSTYLPVRAMGEAVGKEVAFDAENYAVYIGARPMEADVAREPYAAVDGKVYYKDEVDTYGSLELLLQVEKIVKYAEENFTKEELDLAVKEKADYYESMMGELNESYMELFRVDACVGLIINKAVLREEAYDSYRTVKHILVVEEEKALEIIEKIKAGADFDALIEEYNIDPGQTKESSYTFTYGEMVEEFEKAAFEMEENAYTTIPVQSQFGYHIIKRLPLDKEGIDTNALLTAQIEKDLNLLDMGEVVMVEKTGDFGIIDGVVITTSDLDAMRVLVGENATHKQIFAFLHELGALDKMCSEGLITKEEFDNAKLMLDELGIELDIKDEALKEGITRMVVNYIAFTNLAVVPENFLEEFTATLETVYCREYDMLKVFVDGELIVPCDVNKSYVEPKNIDGTVYVPVRAIVEALGMSADWDNDTRTVIIKK